MLIVNNYLNELWGKKKKKHPVSKDDKLQDIYFYIYDLWTEALHNYVDKIIDEVTKRKYGKITSDLRNNIYQIIWVDDEMWEGKNNIDRAALYKLYKPIYDKYYKEQLIRLIKYIPKIKLLWKKFIIEYDKQTKEGKNNKNWKELYKKYKKYMSHSSRKMSINVLDFDHINGKNSGWQGGWDDEYAGEQTIGYFICDYG